MVAPDGHAPAAGRVHPGILVRGCHSSGRRGRQIKLRKDPRRTELRPVCDRGYRMGRWRASAQAQADSGIVVRDRAAAHDGGALGGRVGLLAGARRGHRRLARHDPGRLPVASADPGEPGGNSMCPSRLGSPRCDLPLPLARRPSSIELPTELLIVGARTFPSRRGRRAVRHRTAGSFSGWRSRLCEVPKTPPGVVPGGVRRPGGEGRPVRPASGGAGIGRRLPRARRCPFRRRS
jgi:hypothetical protein